MRSDTQGRRTAARQQRPIAAARRMPRNAARVRRDGDFDERAAPAYAHGEDVTEVAPAPAFQDRAG